MQSETKRYLISGLLTLFCFAILSGCATPSSIVADVDAQQVLETELNYATTDNEVPLRVGIQLFQPGVDLEQLDAILKQEYIEEQALKAAEEADEAEEAEESEKDENALAANEESGDSNDSDSTASTASEEAPAEAAEEEGTNSSIRTLASNNRPRKEYATANEIYSDSAINPSIRRAETHIIPYSLKTIMGRCGHWSEVYVTPGPVESVDLLVDGEIIASNGHGIAIDVTATDSTGRVWMSERFKYETIDEDFVDIGRLSKDPYDHLYIHISNRLAEIKETLSVAELERIRRTTDMRFAADLAPDAFGDYVKKDDVTGTYELLRLPAPQDPNYMRVKTLKTQELLVLGKIEEYYNGLHEGVWLPYLAWRGQVRELSIALEEARAKATNERTRALIAAAVTLAGGVAAAANGAGAIDLIQLGAFGGQITHSIYRAARKNSEIANNMAQEVVMISDEMGTFIRPTVFELEGRTYRLTGDAEERMRTFREIIRQLYFNETGLESAYAAPLAED